jgi:hypothetical protein
MAENVKNCSQNNAARAWKPSLAAWVKSQAGLDDASGLFPSDTQSALFETEY